MIHYADFEQPSGATTIAPAWDHEVELDPYHYATAVLFMADGRVLRFPVEVDPIAHVSFGTRVTVVFKEGQEQDLVEQGGMPVGKMNGILLSLHPLLREGGEENDPI